MGLQNNLKKISSILNKASSLYYRGMTHNATRAISYALVQLSIVEIMHYAALVYYGAEDYNDNNIPVVIAVNASGAILAGFGAYAAIESGRLIQKQESAIKKKKELKLNSSSIIAKGYPIAFAMQVSFLTGLQLYNYALRPFIGDNNNALTISLLTLSGLTTGALAATFQTSKKLERAEAKLVLFKKAPNDKLSQPQSIRENRWTRHLRPLKYATFITPAIKTSSMVTLTFLEALSTAGEYAKYTDLGIYFSLAGIAAGSLNLGAFLVIPKYLGTTNKLLMNFLLYSMYIFLGVGTKIAGIAWLSGNEDMANDLTLNGWLWLAVGMGALLGPSVAFDHLRMQKIFQAEVKQHRERKLSSQITELTADTQTLISIYDNFDAVENGLSKNSEAQFAFFKPESNIPIASEENNDVELQPANIKNDKGSASKL